MQSIERFVKGRVTGDVPEMFPEIQQLVSMIDSEPSLPVYKFVNDYLEKVDSSLDFQVCMLLYPDAKKKEELEYLPECKAVGISEVELITSGAVRGILTSLMTRGLMVEIYRYGGKYFGDNCINKFYETIRAIFQINQMITTEQCSLFSKVRRDAEKMAKLKRNKQLKQVKAEIFGIADLPGKKADDEVDPLIERLRSFDIKVGVVGIPVEVRGGG
jgi:hypothetical protein